MSKESTLRRPCGHRRLPGVTIYDGDLTTVDHGNAPSAVLCL
jgi:hypothetical protein